MNFYRIEEQYVYGTDEMDALRRFNLDCEHTDLIPIANDLTESECIGLLEISKETSFGNQVRKAANLIGALLTGRTR